jgi:hypothetical protein
VRTERTFEQPTASPVATPRSMLGAIGAGDRGRSPPSADSAIIAGADSAPSSSVPANSCRPTRNRRRSSARAHRRRTRSPARHGHPELRRSAGRPRRRWRHRPIVATEPTGGLIAGRAFAPGAIQRRADCRRSAGPYPIGTSSNSPPTQVAEQGLDALPIRRPN